MQVLRVAYGVATESVAITRMGRGTKGKLALLLTYLRLRLKVLVVTKLLKFLNIRVKNEKFLGFEVKFFDFAQFFSLFREIFVNEYYGFSATKPDPVIIDCGSHVGISILYFKFLYPEAEIWGFEADEDTFEALKLNVMGNGLQNVNLIQSAVWKHDGLVSFHRYTPESVGSSVVERSHRMTGQTLRTEVSCTRLSKFLTGPVDLLKLNIEGAECEVLEEVSSKLHLVREIKIDFGFDTVDHGTRLRRVLEILEQHGFTYTLATSVLRPLHLRREQPYHIAIHAYRVQANDA